jgi:hypothetical protein
MVAVVVEENGALMRSGSRSTRPLRRILWHLPVSVILIMLGSWSIYYNWPLRSIRFNELVYSEQAAHRLKGYPDAQYAYGMQAWLDQQPEKAADFFCRAVSRNVLFIDAWLRLAEIEAALGREGKARAMLTFTTDITGQAMHWKWPQMVLANQLGMDSSFYGNANDLLTRKTLEQDTLQLLHTHVDGDASAMINVLEPQNLPAYLAWLMRWGMAEKSMAVWQAMTATTRPEKNTALRYAHFLLSHKRIRQAVDIWQEYTGGSGLTNPGFENKITGQGFDWRFWREKESDWELKRVYSESAEGNYALQLKFNGKANVSFQHLYQIVAVTPQTHYRLTYAWKTKGITTDQGPFVEIVGYDAKGIHETGPMMTGSTPWRDETITVAIPADCHAVVIRLRRKTSMRFDSKIRGRVWLDNFRLERIETDPQVPDAAATERF